MRILLFLVSWMFTTSSFAAGGGGINGKIYQDSEMNNSKILGIQTKVNIDFPLDVKINTIKNKGLIDNAVIQNNYIDNSIVIGADVNTVENHGSVSQVINESRVCRSKIIINLD